MGGKMDNSHKITLALLFMFIFMVGVLVGLWATKNTFANCNKDLKYCVDKYREDWKINLKYPEVGLNGTNKLWEIGNGNQRNGNST